MFCCQHLTPPAACLCCSYLNDENYHGGFEQEELNQLFSVMQHNFRAWLNGFAPLAVGADLDSPAVEEFSRTFFNIRPDIALSVTKSIFQSDMRRIIPQVATLQRHLSLPTIRMCDASKIQCTWSAAT